MAIGRLTVSTMEVVMPQPQGQHLMPNVCGLDKLSGEPRAPILFHIPHPM